VGLLAVGTLLFAVYLVRLDWQAVYAAVSAFPPGIALWVVALNLFAGVLKFGRWSKLLQRRGIEMPGSRFEEYLAINAGFFLGLVTPGTSGELSRSAFSGVESKRAMAIVSFEKLTDLGVLLLMVAGSAVVQFTTGMQSWLVSFAIIAVTVVAYSLFLRFDWVVTAPFRFLLGRVGNDEQIEKARSAYRELYELCQDRTAVIGSIAFSALLWVLPVVQMHLILNGFGVDVPIKTSAFAFLLPYLIGVVSMMPAGIGAFDMAVTEIGTRAISLAGVAAAMGALAPICFRILVTVPLIALGYVSQIALNIRRTRKARETAG
jgi:uncharacterized protein (TIRG00374 family)